MKRIKGVIVSTVLLVSLLTVITPVSAQDTAVWVDDNFNASTPGWQTTHFDKIHDGVDNVADGGTVYVAAGTYIESVTIGDKTVYLIGADSSSTIIDGQGDNCITINQANGGEIKNFTLRNGNEGIMIRNCENIIIDGNAILDNDSSGLSLEDSHNNSIRNNDINNNWSIILVHSWGNQIEHNELDGGMTLSLYDYSNNNIVRDNVLLGGGCTLIRSIFSENNLIANNELTGNQARYGIYLGYSTGSIIANNDISGIEEYGIGFYHVDNAKVLGNTLSNPENGVIGGVFMWGSSCNNLIKGNEIYDMPKGISLHYNTNNNQIVNNRVSNSETEIIIDNSNDNIIYQNNFEDNHIQGFDNSTNEWSYNGLGNYWGDYAGKDENNDNIGDSSYQIPPNGSDPFPSMTPYSIESIITPSLNPIDFYELQEIEIAAITDDVTWEGQNKELTHVDIMDGGSLTITNSTITFLPRSGFSGLEVFDGGTLRIINSKIFANGKEFLINDGSVLEIRNSEIYNAGNWDGGETIKILTDNVIIKDNLIVDSWGIRLFSNSEFINNTIENSYNGIHILGSDCVVEKNIIKNVIWSGISLPNWLEFGGCGSNNIIRENTIQNVWKYPISVDCTNNKIYHNNSTFVPVIPALTGTFALNKSQYAVGEAVEIHLRSTSDTPITLPQGAPWVVYKVRNGNLYEVFRPPTEWGITNIDDRMTWRWNQKDSNDNPVPEGTYKIVLIPLNAGEYSATFTITKEVPPTPTSQEPVLPCVFMGMAYLDGDAVSDGTVTAWIGGERVGEDTTDAYGSYYMQVTGNYAGETVSFKVNGIEATEIPAWFSGATESVDVHATTPGEPSPGAPGGAALPIVAIITTVIAIILVFVFRSRGQQQPPEE